MLDNDKGEDGNIWADNAATHGLAPALTVAASAVAGVAVGKEETDTVWKEDTLFHGKALLVVSTGDAEDVALEFVAKGVSLDLLSDFLVIEDTAVKSCKCQYEESIQKLCTIRTIFVLRRCRSSFVAPLRGL